MSDPQPGRDAQGRWLRNDATAEQFAVGVVSYLRNITEHLKLAGIYDSARYREKCERLDWLEECAKLVDAGERPAKE